MIDRARIEQRLDGALAAIASLGERVDAIQSVIDAVFACLGAGGTLYTAGNGGSAAEALHLAEELIGRYGADRPALRAVCLNADPTAMTCIANDYGFERLFARQCEALLTPADALVVLSTSGKSPNLLAALEVARSAGATTIGLLARDGGPALALCDHAIVVPTDESAHAQEAHQVLIHLICEALEP